jgi:hypothetical protein
MDRACSTNWGEKNICIIYKILVEKPEGKRLLGRPRHRWVDNNIMGSRETGWDGIDRIDLAQDRDQWRALVNSVTNLHVPLNIAQILSTCTSGGFTRGAELHGIESYHRSILNLRLNTV